MSTVAIMPEEQSLMAEHLARFVHDPLGAVLYGFPWGEGDLAGLTGPRDWQREVLKYIGDHLQNPETRHEPCRIAISSGHGPGKSALAAFVIWWGSSTFPDCKVIVTANTKTQLDTKTQPEAAKWFRLALNTDWFEVNVTSIKFRDAKDDKTWRCDLIPWSESNPQAFAGAHNARKRVVIICDEASEISDLIYEVIEGALTDADTEIILLLLGNPTRNVGYFYDAVFGRARARWKTWVIDSRNVEGTNKKEIDEAVEIYGEDSDFVRVRYRGLPPRAGSAQFIDLERIQCAQKREPLTLPDDPLVAGVDFAWGGDDDNVVRFRRGLDARTIKSIKIKGEFTRDPAVMLGRLSDVLTTAYECNDGVRRKVDMVFLDSAGIAAPVEARLRALGHTNIMAVNFGADSPKPECAYLRDFMWEQMKQWLLQGAIDTDAQLEADLSAPVLVSDLKQRIKLESKDDMKKRLKRLGKEGKSPDDADALALTFAMPVIRPKPVSVQPPQVGWLERSGDGGWMR